MEVLGQVKALACESSSASRRLMSALGLPCPRLIVHREEGRERSAEVILELLRGGVEVALVSEAGTPGISDPGRDLVERCHAEQIPVRVVPGPCSVVAAISASGLPARRWAFEGFLPARGADRQERLERLASEERTLVLLEAPHRLLETLRDLLRTLGEREACLGRELTKRFEESRKATLSQLIERLENEAPRGECVLVVGPGAPVDPGRPTLPVDAIADWMREQGLGSRQVADFLAQFAGMRRKEAYQLALERQDRTEV